MGLIKALFGAASGVLADQWVDFFACEAMPETILLRPGARPQQRRSGNQKFSENIIANGSKINVADGQCMLIVENGRIADYCSEPGQYTYDNAVAPSMLGGGLRDLGRSFAEVGKRFVAGGAPTTQQFIYFVNTKEIIGNKIGWGNIPFRDSEFQMTVRVQGFGQYSFKIVDPLLFYSRIVGNWAGEYTRDKLAEQMKSEVLSALMPALGRIAQTNVPYDMLINYPREIGSALNSEMSAEWRERRGIEIVSLAMESVTVDEASAKKIEQLQEARALSNPLIAAGRLAAGQVNAMEAAANNTSGAMTGFLGLGMAQNLGGMNATNLFQQASQPPAQPPPAVPQPTVQPQTAQPAPTVQKLQPSVPEGDVITWDCACGAANAGKFCHECGAAQPMRANTWTCACGAANAGKFCHECGSAQPPQPNTWTCTCGAVISGKFCQECGAAANSDDHTKGQVPPRG